VLKHSSNSAPDNYIANQYSTDENSSTCTNSSISTTS